MLAKSLVSPLDSKEIEPVNPKGNKPWTYIGMTDAEAEGLILWPPDMKSWLTGKDLDAGEDWGQEKKGVTEGMVVGWHHQLSRRDFEKILGDSEEQESLSCSSPLGHKNLDRMQQLNNKTNPQKVFTV